MAAGDSYLAANLGIFKAMVVGTHLDNRQETKLFGDLLETTMALNPSHEDAYYQAQATLPWEGFHRLNQRIQVAATRERPWDWLPAYFAGFNLYYFAKDPESGAHYILKAADRTSNPQKAGLRSLAGRWISLGTRPQEALKMVQAMAESTRHRQLKRDLDKRQDQLRGLIRLQEAERSYRQKTGQSPDTLPDLIGFAGLKEIPEDPFKRGYQLDTDGHVIITPPKTLSSNRGQNG